MGAHVTVRKAQREGLVKVTWVRKPSISDPGNSMTGRDISRTDATSPKVTLVNGAFVQKWLDGANPIGARDGPSRNPAIRRRPTKCRVVRTQIRSCKNPAHYVCSATQLPDRETALPW